jgi:DnaK suppressor protein
VEAERARELLAAERADVEALLREVSGSGKDDRDAEGELGDASDDADALESEGVDDAIEASLRARLAAVERAEQRLAEGTYGLSVRSGQPIPDARLEVAPTAELTIEEAQADS